VQLAASTDRIACSSAPGLLPAMPALEQMLGDLGTIPDLHYVITIDESGGWAGRFILDTRQHRPPPLQHFNGGIKGLGEQDVCD